MATTLLVSVGLSGKVTIIITGLRKVDNNSCHIPVPKQQCKRGV
jgi:hypothetical protein